MSPSVTDSSDLPLFRRLAPPAIVGGCQNPLRWRWRRHRARCAGKRHVTCTVLRHRRSIRNGRQN
eukprot:2804936-Pleurochrysis_carterae.AAC.1